jgi:hypothetical protein
MGNKPGKWSRFWGSFTECVAASGPDAEYLGVVAAMMLYVGAFFAVVAGVVVVLSAAL